MKASTALLIVKLLHTAAWVVFAGCIVALPITAYLGHFQLALVLIGAVTVEIAVLALNHWACPLTAVAARYTVERQANFDIFLPLWLARYNKQVFGGLYAAGLLYTAIQWWRYSGDV